VRRVDGASIIATVAGDGYLHAIGDGGAAQDAILALPSAVALDPAGNLTIADTGTQRVRQVASGTITTLAGTGWASSAGLNQPMSVAADAAGTVYIADTGNSLIRAIGSDHRLRTITAAVQSPRGVCLSRLGVLHVVDTGNGRVLRVGAATAIAATQLNAPEACALDSSGNLYIAETGAHRVRRLSPAGEWTTIAGTGTAGSDGDEGPATAAHLSFPRGLTVDDAGNVWVSDTGGNRVRQVTPDGVIHTIAGTGAPGFSGDGEDALSARLNGPAGLFLDGSGALYVADSLNDRIRRLVPGAAAAPVTEPVSVVNALSGIGGSVAPGELVLVSGKGFGGEVTAGVWFGTRSAPVLVSLPGQLTVQVPEELSDTAPVRLEVRVAGNVVGTADLGVAAAAPGVLPLTLNQDGSMNSGLSPAPWGATLTLFATGAGTLQAARPVLPVSVTIAGVDADVLRAEAGAGATGLMLVVVRVPGGFLASGQAPLVLTVGGVKAAPVWVWLR